MKEDHKKSFQVTMIYDINQIKVLKEALISVLFLLSTTVSIFSQDTVQRREIHDVYLFGNLVDASSPGAFYTALEKELNHNTNQFTIILNGDIIDHQIELSTQDIQMKNIFQLVDKIGKYKNGRLVLIPGDRDWNNNRMGGYECVRSLEKELKAFVQNKLIQNFYWPIKNACPGPFDIDLDEHIQLVHRALIK